ncbi:MAG TPA: GGDEF domain-containing protein [Acidobacteriota bacterium]|nr:GGDEF domain-containing protein [Acidobacteriota bacterium]
MGEKKTNQKKEFIEQTANTSITGLVKDKPKKVFLFFLSGPLQGHLFPLSEGTTILGRSQESDIVINDNRISRKHLKFKLEEGKAVIEDLKSTNGTFVNGEKIKRTELKLNDKVHMSPTTVFKFSLADEDEKVALDELYELGVNDPLTGVYNKRYLIERLKEEINHSKRFEIPLSLVMIDIDHFKKINDTYGHLAGDQVLIKIAELIRSVCRNTDILARYGGEEFSIILRNTDETGAAVHAERVRKKIARKTFNLEREKIKITVSLGIAGYQDPSQIKDEKHFIEMADRCLYHSKQNGRNLFTKASEIMKI